MPIAALATQVSVYVEAQDTWSDDVPIYFERVRVGVVQVLTCIEELATLLD
jgi:hypothetical protein